MLPRPNFKLPLSAGAKTIRYEQKSLSSHIGIRATASCVKPFHLFSCWWFVTPTIGILVNTSIDSFYWVFSAIYEGVDFSSVVFSDWISPLSFHWSSRERFDSLSFSIHTSTTGAGNAVSLFLSDAIASESILAQGMTPVWCTRKISMSALAGVGLVNQWRSNMPQSHPHHPQQYQYHLRSPFYTHHSSWNLYRPLPSFSPSTFFKISAAWHPRFLRFHHPFSFHYLKQVVLPVVLLKKWSMIVLVIWPVKGRDGLGAWHVSKFPLLPQTHVHFRMARWKVRQSYN